jgi:hypothetical protein
VLLLLFYVNPAPADGGGECLKGARTCYSRDTTGVSYLAEGIVPRWRQMTFGGGTSVDHQLSILGWSLATDILVNGVA